MATLSEADRARIWRGLMRYWSNTRTAVIGTETELLITVNETDAWIDAAQANYVNSLTYGDNYTAVQKMLLFCCVAAIRISPAVATLLRRLLSVEVD